MEETPVRSQTQIWMWGNTGLEDFKNEKNEKKQNFCATHTDSDQRWWDGFPDTDASFPEPLSDGQFQVEQRETLKYQSDEIWDKECTYKYQVEHLKRG